MSNLAHISTSGMNAAQAAMDVSARNLANLATSGSRPQQAVPSSLGTGGADTQVSQAAEASSGLETDIVGMLQSKNAFLANLAVFRASDSMLGYLLDVQS